MRTGGPTNSPTKLIEGLDNQQIHLNPLQRTFILVLVVLPHVDKRSTAWIRKDLVLRKHLFRE